MIKKPIHGTVGIILFYLMIFLSAARKLPNKIENNNSVNPQSIINNELIISNQKVILKNVSEDSYQETPSDKRQDQLITIDLSQKKTPLEGEIPLMLREFKDINYLYNRLPSASSARINLLRRLLVRLKKLNPETEFLEGQKKLMKAAIRYRLGIRGKAFYGVEELIKNTSCVIIKKEAIKLLSSYSLMNPSIISLQDNINKYKQSFSPEINAYLDLINRKSNQFLKEEIDLIVNEIIQAPIGTYDNQDAYINLLTKIYKYLEINDLDKIINIFLLDNRLSAVIPVMKLRLKKYLVPFETLELWGDQLQSHEKSLIQLLKLTKNKSEDYLKYIKQYEQDRIVLNRGKVYNLRLYRYRGLGKDSYNLYYTDKYFNNYLKGEIEEKYVTINAEYAFRNFLVYKRYDKIVKYANIIHEKISNKFTSPYVNFWESYALLQLGQTNQAIPLLSDIIASDPESYYGIIAQNTIRDIFKIIPFSRMKHFKQLEKSATNRIAMLKYAYNLYYLGSGIEKSQGERVFYSLGKIRPKSRLSISTKDRNLIEAYLYLGLEKEARYLVYNLGVKNPYNQDLIFNKYFVRNNYTKNSQEIVAKRGILMNTINTFMLKKDILRLYYPRPYQESLIEATKDIDRKIDLNLIYAVMRTESFYKNRARSHVGAKGLMQIMPVTGKWLIDKYLPDIKDYSLYDTDINLYLGSIYLYDNIDKMGFLPALAAYNSGPTYVRKLMRRYKPKNNIELVEIHPKKETRSYVKKVIESYQRYKYVYGNDKVNISQII